MKDTAAGGIRATQGTFSSLFEISQLLFQTGSLNFVYTMRTNRCYIENKTKVLIFIFAFFF